MKDFIRFILENNWEECKEKSFVNCHTKGLHSIMLIDKPEQRVRLFITDKDHDLWKNENLNYNMSVALHPHHCDIQLINITGDTYNIIYRVCDANRGKSVDRYQYTSKINTNEGKFILLDGKANIYYSSMQQLTTNITMSARELHTIFVRKGEITCWMIVEGKEDSLYKPIYYSLRDLSEFNTEGLYVKPDEEEFKRILKLIEIDKT